MADLKETISALKLEVQQIRDELQELRAANPIPNDLTKIVPTKSYASTAWYTKIDEVSVRGIRGVVGVEGVVGVVGMVVVGVVERG